VIFESPFRFFDFRVSIFCVFRLGGVVVFYSSFFIFHLSSFGVCCCFYFIRWGFFPSIFDSSFFAISS
jgi:hypothetical protein